MRCYAPESFPVYRDGLKRGAFCQARDTQDGTEILAIKGPLFFLAYLCRMKTLEMMNVTPQTVQRGGTGEARRGEEQTDRHCRNPGNLQVSKMSCSMRFMIM